MLRIPGAPPVRTRLPLRAWAVAAGMTLFFGWKVVWTAFAVAVFGWAFGFYVPSILLHLLHEQRGWSLSLVSAALYAGATRQLDIVSVIAVAAGAVALEKHFTYRKEDQAFHDHKLSADPADLAALVDAVRQAEIYLGSVIRSRTDAEQKCRKSFHAEVASLAAVFSSSATVSRMRTG
mgnify:CR=1 FL=1